MTYGYKTKDKRRKLSWEKSHHLDAYLISFHEGDVKSEVDWNNVVVYEYMQFRRHHRQIIHAVRERNYKDGKKVVAKNRKKRTGQKTKSLADLVAKIGKQIMARLRVLPGKKVVRSRFDKLTPGDVVRYDDKVYVIKGYGNMGRKVGFVDRKEYVPTQDCSIIRRNTGIVCL